MFLSDLRLTEHDRDGQGEVVASHHADNTLKFITVGSTLRLFPAGSVRFWQGVAASLESVIDQVTVDSAVELNGPLHVALDAAAGSTQPTKYAKGAGALGVVLDPESGKNVVFNAVVHYGGGALLTEVRVGESILIGTGGDIHGLHEAVGSRVESEMKRLAFDTEVWDDLNDLFCAIREAVQNVYQRAGPGAYVQFDTGPVFVGNLLNGGQLTAVGETVDFFELRGGVSTTTSYQFGVDGDGCAFIRDLNTGTSVPLDLLANSPALAKGSRSDPQRREAAPPLQETFDGCEMVYRVNQRVHTSGGFGSMGAQVREILGGDALVQRDVQRVTLATREVTTLASATRSPDSSPARFPTVTDQYFALDEDQRTTFEAEIADHLFDEAWWRERAPKMSRHLYRADGWA